MTFSQRSLWVLLVASLGLGACEVSPEIASEGGSTISCALGGATDFTGECRLVEVGDGSANYLIMRHPDGGFRRLARAETVSGLAEFDGAQEAESWREGDAVVLAIGEDRYRWCQPVRD